MGSDSVNHSNRQFQRVQFESEGAAHALLGAEAIWSNADKSTVFDMSYTGIALGRPKTLELKVCHKYPLKIKLGPKEECEIVGEVMWFNDTVVGIAFEPLDSKARIIFNEFLDDKLIGANLHEISPKLFGSIMDCDHWFQGPKDTNVFLWIKEVETELTIHRAVVELDDFFLRFENGRVIEVAGGASEGGVHSKYAEIKNEVSVKELARQDIDFVSRVVGVLSQIRAQQKPIKKLIEILAKDSAE